MFGLVGAVLTAAALPVVASAAPEVSTYGLCHKSGAEAGGWQQSGFGPWTVIVEDGLPTFHGPFGGNVPFDGSEVRLRRRT